MKGLWLLLSAVILLPNAFAATITGNVSDSTPLGAVDGAEVLIYPKQGPYLNGPTIVTLKPIKVLSQSDGSYSVSLRTGQYFVTVDGSPLGWIPVPDDNNTYPINSLIGELVIMPHWPTNFPGILYADAHGNLSWTPQGNGTLQEVDIIGGSGISVAGSPGTGTLASFTITLGAHTHNASDLNAGVLNVARVVSTSADGQIPYPSGQQLTSNAAFHYDAATGTLYVGNLVISSLVVNGTNSPPSTSSSAGLPGQVAWDSSYLYQCVAANTWKRAAISSW